MTMVKQVKITYSHCVEYDQNKFLALTPETMANSDFIHHCPRQVFAGVEKGG